MQINEQTSLYYTLIKMKNARYKTLSHVAQIGSKYRPSH